MIYRNNSNEEVDVIYWNGKNRKSVEKWVNDCSNVSVLNFIGDYMIIENYGTVVQINPFFYLVRSRGRRKCLREVICQQELNENYKKIL